MLLCSMLFLWDWGGFYYVAGVHVGCGACSLLLRSVAQGRIQFLVVCCFVLTCPLQHQHVRAMCAAESASGMHVVYGVAAPGVLQSPASYQAPCCDT
jgi:hypothetical protein